MVWQTLEAKLSTPRMNRYLRGHQGNQDHAAAAYVHNMRIAESLVSIFHVLEVGLRNGIQREMVREFQREDWYEAFKDSTNPELLSSYKKVDDARTALRKRGVNPSPDALTAELSFGFWAALFNRKAFPDVSKPLMKVFFYCPKHARRADVIRSRLNNARGLRNRCFHHERFSGNHFSIYIETSWKWCSGSTHVCVYGSKITIGSPLHWLTGATGRRLRSARPSS